MKISVLDLCKGLYLLFKTNTFYIPACTPLSSLRLMSFISYSINSAVVGITFLSAAQPRPFVLSCLFPSCFSSICSSSGKQYVTIKEQHTPTIFIVMIHSVEKNTLLHSAGFVFASKRVADVFFFFAHYTNLSHYP